MNLQRLTGIFLPKSYISEATSIQIRFVSDARIEGLGFFLTYTEYNVGKSSLLSSSYAFLCFWRRGWGGEGGVFGITAECPTEK